MNTKRANAPRAPPPRSSSPKLVTEPDLRLPFWLRVPNNAQATSHKTRQTPESHSHPMRFHDARDCVDRGFVTLLAGCLVVGVCALSWGPEARTEGPCPTIVFSHLSCTTNTPTIATARNASDERHSRSNRSSGLVFGRVSIGLNASSLSNRARRTWADQRAQRGATSVFLAAIELIPSKLSKSDR